MKGVRAFDERLDGGIKTIDERAAAIAAIGPVGDSIIRS